MQLPVERDPRDGFFTIASLLANLEGEDSVVALSSGVSYSAKVLTAMRRAHWRSHEPVPTQYRPDRFSPADQVVVERGSVAAR